ncbi:MAG TPA: NADH-quinone oxidoreductase subunit NuoG [Patescibacteria group bacterium]|nr:NADH-quinone oxidoreductase subunit NuoG [Patescibacteria group bacterium]
MAEQKLVTLTIDGRPVTVPAGTLVIEATRRMGIEVPSFCYYPGLSLQAACRMCFVEVEKAPKLQTACTLTAVDGMVVRTDTPQVREGRKAMLEFLLTNHPLDCPVCDKGGECELQDMVFRYGADTSRFVEEKIHEPEEKWSELVYYDAPRCILCFRCVRVCDEGLDVKALGVGQRGVHSTIIPNRGDHLECEECGMCIDVCPVGALTSGAYRYKTRPWEMHYVGTICAHCSNGCKTTLSVRNNRILRANNRDLSGINREFLCVKGRFGFDFTEHPDRLTQPLVRRGTKLEPVTWEAAMEEVAPRLAAIRAESGPDAIGFIGSNRTTNEENYLLGRLARATIGTNNVDHHRTADYASLAGALGSKATASALTMEALGTATAILLIGNDTGRQNPLVDWRIREAVRHVGARVYVVDSGEIKLARRARLYARIPEGAEAAATRALAGKGAAPAGAGEPLAAIKKAIEAENNVAILFGAGVTGAAVTDLVAWGATLPGQTRYMPLGDYANSRGAAEMGQLPDALPGFARVDDAAAREKFGTLWGAKLPDRPGMTAKQMLDAAAAGTLKALYVVGANPFRTFGSGGRPSGLKFLVAHDLFLTETSREADVVLPAASAYEKNGTVTNTAGEVQLVRKGADPPGVRSDFDILRILAHQLERKGLGKPWNARNPDAVFEEIRRNVPGYGVDLAGLLAGGAVLSSAAPSNGNRAFDVPAGAIRSAQDSLFTSGTLGRFCMMIESLAEAGKTE